MQKVGKLQLTHTRYLRETQRQSDTSMLLLVYSFQNLKRKKYLTEAGNLNVRDSEQLCRNNYVQAYSGLVELVQACAGTLLLL